jgi:hypothetical protein
MSGTRSAEPAAEPAQEPVAPEPLSGATATAGTTPARSATARADMLSRLPTDAARRDYVRAMGAAYGNRDTARLVARAQAPKRSVARLIDASAVETIAKGAAGKPMAAHHLLWELIHLFAPEKAFSLSGSTYEAAQVGFRLDGSALVIGDDVVARVARGDTTAVGQELKTALAGVADPFKQLAAGGVSVKDAPEHIGVPRVIQEGAEAAWSKSLPGTKSQEQGGVIIEDSSGGYGYKAGKAGTSGTFSPNYNDVKKKKGEKLLGTLHTHPYSAKEGGYTDVTFSGGDLADMVNGRDKIALVRSGDGWFAVATSKEFEARIAKAKSKLKLFNERWDALYKAASGNTKERAASVTPKVCLEYDLLYYAGSESSLSMPPDMVKAYKGTP